MTTHSKEMYNYLRKNLRYEKKVHIKKEVLLAPNFEEEINRLDKGITSSNNQDETDDNDLPSQQKRVGELNTTLE